jgi:serine/threonine protein kinase
LHARRQQQLQALQRQQYCEEEGDEVAQHEEDRERVGSGGTGGGLRARGRRRVRFKHASAQVRELLDRLLQMHPEDRLTAETALSLPFFAGAEEVLPESSTRASSASVSSPSSLAESCSCSHASFVLASSSESVGSHSNSNSNSSSSGDRGLVAEATARLQRMDNSFTAENIMKHTELQSGTQRGQGEEGSGLAPTLAASGRVQHQDTQFLFETRHPSRPRRSRRSSASSRSRSRVRDRDLSHLSLSERRDLVRGQRLLQEDEDEEDQREQDRREEAEELRAEILLEGEVYVCMSIILSAFMLFFTTVLVF